jgi:hypothetical protein
MKKELAKTPWFSSYPPPSRPGVYLTRSASSGNRVLSWWRAFDGENWHAGIIAVSAQGLMEAKAPRYKDAVKSTVIGEYISIQWCGRIK